jgi:hypothetical protein
MKRVIQNVNRTLRDRLPRVIKHYFPAGRTNHGRPLKRLLDAWDRNGSTSGPTPWQIYDDDDDDDNDDDDDRGVLLADSHCIFNKWEIYFCFVMECTCVKDVTYTKIHITEPVVIEPSAFDLQMVIEKLKRHKSPSIDHSPTELIPAAVHTVSCVVYELVNCT